MYTDGSLHEDFSSGGGFALYKNQWKLHQGLHGPEWYMEEKEVKESFNAFYLYRSPIYQCEIWTILKACQYILDNHTKLRIKSVTFFVDSHAAILSLFSPFIKSKLVNQTIKALNELNRFTNKKPEIRWIKAHTADDETDPNSRLSKLFQGSTKADRLANFGSKFVKIPPSEGSKTIVPKDEVPLWPLSEIKRRLFTKIREYWRWRWTKNGDNQPPCLATKRFLPDLDSSFWAIFTRKEGNTRRVFSEMISIITDHNYLASFEHKIKRIDSPNCTICNNDKEMNAHHILHDCEALEVIRRNSFQKELVAKKLEEGPENPQEYKYELRAKDLVQYLINIRKVCSIIPGYDIEE